MRAGKKKQPFFKIVIVKKTRAPSSKRFIEDLGFYNPLTKEKSIKKERIEHWLKNGATISDSVCNLLISAGILKEKKIPVHKKKKGGDEKKAEAPVDKKP